MHTHSLALTTDGAVWSWGWGGYGRLGHGDEEDQWHLVAAEESRPLLTSIAITADSVVFAWGKDGTGCLEA